MKADPAPWKVTVFPATVATFELVEVKLQLPSDVEVGGTNV